MLNNALNKLKSIPNDSKSDAESENGLQKSRETIFDQVIEKAVV